MPALSAHVLTWNGLSSGRAVLFRGVCGQGVGRFDELSRRPTSGSGGGCYAPSRRAGRVGGGRGGGAGRVGTMWIGCPPLSRARVGTAVCSCAGGCPILCTPMTVRGRWCVERLGDR